MTKIKNYTIVIFIAVAAIILLWLNSYASDFWDYYSSSLGIIMVITVPLLAMFFVKSYKKHKIYINEKSFKILFIISAILFLLGCWGDFELWYNNYIYYSVGNYSSVIFALIIAIIIITIPLLATLFVSQYKNHKGNIDENILFIICIIPFLRGLIDWIIHKGYYTILRCYEYDPYDYGVSPIGKSIAGNFNLVKGMVITYIAIIVVEALKKDSIKCSGFLPRLFILVGIYNSVCNLVYVINNIVFDDSYDFDFVFDLTMNTLGSFVPLQFALLCVMITLLSSFLYGYFSKENANLP